MKDYAKQIKKFIKKHKTIFIMGHKNLDLDAIGSALGMYSIVKKYHKQPFIVVDDEVLELGVKKVVDNQKNINFIKSNQINSLKTDSNLLIIVDTNKANLLSNEKLVEEFDEIIVLDHHQITEKTINKGLKVIEDEISSTCEIITNLIKECKVNIEKDIATAILAGIVLDTNNFSLKISENTYYAAYLLTKLGANPKQAQSYLKQDINDYIIRQQAITNINVLNNKFAITICHNDIVYRREDLAKIADTLLDFNGIEASFVIGRISKDTIGLSARSEGIIDVGNIAEDLGGGGNNYEAASQFENKDFTEIKEALLKAINKEDSL